MATIALYANTLNQMPALISDIKQSVSAYKSDLFSLRQKALNVKKSICDLDDVIGSVQTSTQTQEDKIERLETFSQNSEAFAADVVRTDAAVTDTINQNKADFYEAYDYLKPDSEKTGWEKFCDAMSAVGDWCKEHWVMIVTVLVVIGIAILCVVTFGVAVAAVAAIAGIVSLVMCLADVICMVATGGKDLATVCRENGMGWLGDIFQGISIGCDVVSIVFPAGAAIKSMAKVGVKTFAQASIKSMKTAFKETFEKVFRSGFKDGIKNFGKLAFKTFIVDIDDLKNWKAAKLISPGANKHWIVDGDSLLPNPNTIPGRYNPDGLTTVEIMEKYGANSIPTKNGVADITGFSVADVNITMKNLDSNVIDNVLSGNMTEAQFSSALRNMNFSNADSELLSKYGMSKADFEKALGTKLTWHESFSMDKCFLIPTEIHANLDHIGAIANFKFEFKQIPSISSLVGGKTTQFGFRFGSESVVSALAS